MGPQHLVLRAPEMSILISPASSPSLPGIFIMLKVLNLVTLHAASYSEGPVSWY